MIDNAFSKICAGVYEIPACWASFSSYFNGLVRRMIGSDGSYVIDIISASFWATSSEVTLPKLWNRYVNASGISIVIKLVYSSTRVATYLSSRASCAYRRSAFSTFLYLRYNLFYSLCSSFNYNTSIVVAFEGITSRPE